MKSCPKFHVKKRTLLAIAGCVWLIAGSNVAKLGILSYIKAEQTSVLHVIFSLVIFGVFSTMFYKMSLKHFNRIRLYEEDTKSFWHFFDMKSYLIMTFMISGGIWLRSSGLASSEFIAVFYTGLGGALMFAGVSFWRMYFKYSDKKVDIESEKHWKE